MNGKFRVAGALIFGAVLVVGAFAFRNTDADTLSGSVVATAPERTYIRPDDSDGDGIKDWEEELLGGEGLADLSVENATTSGFEPPDTLTEEVALSFFETYLDRSIDGTLNEENLDSFLAAEVAKAERQTRDELITRDDIRVGADDSFAALRAYGNAVGDVVGTHGNVESDNELSILERALKTNDESVLRELDPIVEGYAGMLEDTKNLAVPPSLAEDHLLLLNAYQAVVSDIRAMQETFRDPLASLIRVKRYEEDTNGLLRAYLGINAALRKAGVEYADDEPGSFFNLFSDI